MLVNFKSENWAIFNLSTLQFNIFFCSLKWIYPVSLSRLKRAFQSVCRVAHMCPFFYCPMFENNVFIFVFLLFFYTYFISLFVHKYCSACCFVLIPFLPHSLRLSDGAWHTQVFVLFLLFSWYISFDWSDKMRSEPVERRVGAHKKFRKVIV